MKIFISHSSKNADYGSALVNLLTGVGVSHESIVFTSDTSYGIPVGENIFDWLKGQISVRPFVIFLLSREYYSSVACLNEMGAAWVVENQHAAIFTPNFDLDDANFRNGALDPREIGFYINDEDRVTEFIDSLREDFSITTNTVLLNRKREEFLEKIRSLGSQDGVAGEKRSKETLSVQKQDGINANSNKELYIPDPSSDLFYFERQFLDGLFFEDEAHSNKVSELYLAKLDPDDLDAIGEWNAFCEYYKLLLTEHGSLAKLVELSKKHQKNSAVQELVARGYLHFDDLKKAQTHLRLAIECCDENSQKIGYLGTLAFIFQKQESKEDISAIVAEMRSLVDCAETEELLLAKLTDLSEWYEEDILKAAMLERELSINPSDISRRFQLAYHHSNTSNHALAMFHYEKIPSKQRDAIVWNNLGVCYQHFSLSGKSIDAYRKAAEKDETLAMSNLAYKAMDAGFLSEADRFLQKAQTQPSCHDNVAAAVVRLNEIPKEEENTLKDELKGMSAKSDFLSHVGEHLWQRMPDIAFKVMIEPNCELSVRVEGETFLATGTLNKNETSFGNALAVTSDPPKAKTYTVEYRGRFVGQVVVGERTEKASGGTSAVVSLLGLAASTRKFIIVMPDSARKFRGMIGDDLLEFELAN